MSLLLTKHIDLESIKETIKALADEEKLLEIIKNDENIFEIREIATKQITNNDLLKEIIFDTSDTEYTKNNLFDIREIAVKQITDEETLIEIVNSYYDDNVCTKYGLNVVKKATEGISNEEVLLSLAENSGDEEIVDLALEKINNKHEYQEKPKVTLNFDDDTKINRLSAIDEIDDDDILLDIAMNAEYLDVREKALNKIKVEDERIIVLKDLIVKEKEYNDAVTDYAISDEVDEDKKQDIIDKASQLGVEYKRAGNSNKEKFFNEQCNLFKNN